MKVLFLKHPLLFLQYLSVAEMLDTFHLISTMSKVRAVPTRSGGGAKVRARRSPRLGSGDRETCRPFCTLLVLFAPSCHISITLGAMTRTHSNNSCTVVQDDAMGSRPRARLANGRHSR